MPVNRDLFGHGISPAQHGYLESPGTAGKLLLKVSLQNLSQYPGAVPSEYFDIVLRDGGTLDLVFEYAQVPRGSFNWMPMFERHSRNSVLHLNTANNDYYQNGIPEVADSIEAAACWMRTVKCALKKQTVRAVGSSMGAYAAMLFGDLVGADFIVAFSPNIGRKTNFFRKNIICRPIADALLRIYQQSIVTFGAFELSDYFPIWHSLEAGLHLDDISLLGNVHGNSRSVLVDKMIMADGPVPARDFLLNPYNTPLDAALIGDLANVSNLIFEQQHGDIVKILRSASAVDVLNPEFQYRLAVHLHLAGRPDEALAAIQEAGRLKVYHNTVAGFEILGPEANYRRKVMHDYAAHLGFAELKAISDLFARAQGNHAVWEAATRIG